MSHAIKIHRNGGPEVLQWEAIDVAGPGPGEVRLRHTAVGLNFIDVYERTGLYSMALPLIPGREAAGVVEAVGKGVKSVRVGDRVAYVGDQSGAYCEIRLFPADRLVPIPDTISDQQAAALMLKGLTAEFLLRRAHRVRRGDTVLLHAAAGGVGLITLQWAKHLGARVIAVVGSQEKAQLARDHGAEHVLLATENWVEQARALTQGRGVDVVYDSVGKETFVGSLDCLRSRGLMVTFGNASGPVPPIAPLELSRRGSLFLTRPTLFHYIATRAELQRAARDLFAVVSQGAIKVHIGQTYALRDAAQAHRDLEARRTTGSTVFVMGE